jgi:cyclic beta-1,2-glucan synthetase
MGYERKRGKLADLNALLLRDDRPRPRACGAAGPIAFRFSIVGDTRVLRTCATSSPWIPIPSCRATRRASWSVPWRTRSIGRVYDSDRQRVCEGYGILQPRVAVSLPGANRSRYARLHGSDAGIDPYTHAVSDVYQDWFRKAPSSARASMTSMSSNRPSRDASPRTVSSAMTCWRAATRAPGC